MLAHLLPFLRLYARNGRTPKVAPRPSLEVTDAFMSIHRATAHAVRRPRSLTDLCEAVRYARAQGATVSIMGLGHSSDGQQFCDGTVMLDVRGLDKVLAVDELNGTTTVEAGVTWEQLVEDLRGRNSKWGLHLKQTLVNRCTVGGSVSVNIHARKMNSPPLVHYVRAFTLVGADGEPRRCSREENAELFSLVVGGYGAFGVLYSVELVLQEVRNLERDPIPKVPFDDVCDLYMEKMEAGYVYGDAHSSARGIVENWAYMTMYKPAVDQSRILPFKNTRTDRWLYAFGMYLLHTDHGFPWAVWKREIEKNGPFTTTDGCQFTSLGEYYEHIHDGVLELEGNDMHVELQIDPKHYREVAAKMREIVRPVQRWGTFCDLRFVRRDTETVLRYAVTDRFTMSPTFHLDRHNEAELRPVWEELFDLVVHEYDGTFYLWDYFLGRPDHIRKAYPQLREFLLKRREHDPDGVFSSLWLRKMEDLFLAGDLAETAK
ncbi:MAG: FAD-binding protein [Myxococcota bacterium]